VSPLDSVAVSNSVRPDNSPRQRIRNRLLQSLRFSVVSICINRHTLRPTYQPAGSPAFFAGNCKFITRKLWGFYNQGGAFMHHGKFTTAREAVEAHAGEALSSRQAFDAQPASLQNDVIEFLKSLQVLPPNSKSLVVDENGRPRQWPPASNSIAAVR
jgi:hypothetical protein